VAAERFAWDHTTVLNIVFLVAFAGLYWVHRNRERFGPQQQYAIDPVCGMQVEKSHPGATLETDHGREYFCSGHCRKRYAERVR
jgi:YHS domain-containing protein